MKTKIIIGLIIILGIGGYLSYFKDNNLKGIESINLNYYQTATNTSIVCSGATSTVVLAAAGQGQRASFELTVASSTSITLCKKATGCVLGSGLTIASTTGNYEQNDAYYGAYSCIGNNAVSSTVGLIYNQ